MKILVIGMTENRGGIEMYLNNLVRYTDLHQIEYDFVCEKENLAYQEYLIKEGCNIIHIPWRRKNILKHMKALRSLVKKYKEYEVIYINAMSAACLPSVLAVSGLKRKILIHSRNNNTKYRKVHQLLRPFLNLLIHERWACSPLAGQFMFGNKPFTVIQNGIDFEKFKYDVKIRECVRQGLKSHNRNYPENAFVVGFVGNLTYQKNVLYMLSVFKTLLDYEKNAILLIIGDGELRQEVESYCRSYKIENHVIMTGKVKNVERYYQAMDVFLLPSRYEGFGNVLIEAQAAGLPCVCSKDVIPQTTQITNEITYISLDAGERVWVDALLEHKEDVRHEFRGKSKEVPFEVHTAVSKIEKLLLELA